MSAGDAYEITWLVRRLFRAMAGRADEYLSALDITAADRAVLEFLSAGGPLTVPEIAARYDVSRQHVQVTVNRLLDKGLVAAGPNPRHKRSALISITANGRQLFSRIRRREHKLIDDLFSDIPASNQQVTRRTLKKVYARLSN
jgi:DNA-binding MarR family transcriptional regulator